MLMLDAEQSGAEAVLEHECRESERGADGEHVHQDRGHRDDDAPEDDEQQREGNEEDQPDRIRSTTREDRGEVTVLCCWTTDLGERNGMTESGAQRIDER